MDKIDIRDLRVGNWIYHKDCPISLQVSGVKDSEVCLKHSFEHNRTVGFVRQDRPSACNIDEIKPIPLTEEILIKNGFPEDEWHGSFPEDKNGLLYIVLSSNKIFWEFDNYRIKLKSVHQLQNILRDLEIEKDIVL